MTIQKKPQQPQDEAPEFSNQETTGDSETEDVSPWHEFLTTASDDEIKLRYTREIKVILSKYPEILSQYCVLALMNTEGRIGTFDLDQVFKALTELNPKKDRDVLLLLISNGGAIEPAYQISKICKAFSKKRFIVCVPRLAKSAATLVAIGADEIHMGALGQLGPIDPQLGGLPALGVSQALRSLASLAQEFPGSSEMFARYLRMALTVEQIGYCERISESASQYASRLLSTKPSLSKKANGIAKELVYEYKHHGFVIDLDEARQHLGADWLLSDTPETALAEEIYNLFDLINLFLRILQEKYIWINGAIDTGIFIIDSPKNE